MLWPLEFSFFILERPTSRLEAIALPIQTKRFLKTRAKAHRPNLLAIRGGLHIILKNGAKLVRHIKATEEAP